MIGLRVAAEHEDRFARIIVGNGALPVGDPSARPSRLNILAFLAWRTFAVYSPTLPISRDRQRRLLRTLSPGERRAYDAPFPDAESKAGARAFPRLVPISPRDPAIAANRRAWEVLGRWQKPFLTVFSDRDPIMRGGERTFQKHVPGAAGQPHSTTHGGHFLQEDAGPELAQKINELIAADAGRGAEQAVRG